MKLIVAENEIVCRAAASWIKARYRRNGCFVGNGYTVAWPQIFQDSVELQKAEYSKVWVAVKHNGIPAFSVFLKQQKPEKGVSIKNDVLDKWIEEGRQMIRLNSPIRDDDGNMCSFFSNVLIYDWPEKTNGVILGFVGEGREVKASDWHSSDL